MPINKLYQYVALCLLVFCVGSVERHASEANKHDARTVTIAGKTYKEEEIKHLTIWTKVSLYWQQWMPDFKSEKTPEKSPSVITKTTQDINNAISDEMRQTLLLALSILIAHATVYGFIKGYKGDYVFYEDGADLAKCFWVAFIPFAALFVLLRTESYFLTKVVAVIFGLFFVGIMMRSIKINKRLYGGFSVAVAKLALSFIFIFQVVNIIITIRTSNQSNIDRKNSLAMNSLIMMALSPIFIKLVNGKKETSALSFLDKIKNIR